MKWNKGNPEKKGYYLVRYIWHFNRHDYKEVGIGRYYPALGWNAIGDADGEWSEGVAKVTGWLPLPEYGED